MPHSAGNALYDPSALTAAGNYDNGVGNWWSNSIDSKSLDKIFNAQQAGIERQFNASEAEKQREWEQMMSNTAYQRAVEDIKSAGLNPYILYGTGGSPASTPTGTSARSSGAAASGNGSTVVDLLKTVANTALKAVTVGAAIKSANVKLPESTAYKHTRMGFLADI
ncbi:minor capsid protein [Capybara microvirus Cap1_SP_240]|nr:minor capsid protein [Capybara microvirus Cap1_SP_240]